MNLFRRTRNNLAFVTYLLLTALKIKVNYSSVVNYVESHPQYPSLLTISDCLSQFKVTNQVYQLDKNDYRDAELPFPFITHSSIDKGSFSLVQEVDADDLKITDEMHQKLMISKQEFFSTWEGIILVAYPDDDSGEIDFFQHYTQSLIQKTALPLLLVVIFSLLIFVFSLHTFTWLILWISTLKLIGLAIGIILLTQSINSNSSVVNKICGLVQKSDCNAILQSKAAKITSWLSWSEVGFFYFAGTFLTILILPEVTHILGWVNLMALPFTIYSIADQYKSKQWCILCCAVQGLLLLELICFQAFAKPIEPSGSSLLDQSIIFLLCFLLPVLVWGVLKPVLIKSWSLKSVTQQLNSFRYNIDLFKLALYNQEQIEVLDQLKPIRLGNPLATTVLTIVSNPFCQPCAKAHRVIEEWLQTRDDLSVQIILLVNNQPIQKRVAQHLLALGMSNDQEVVREALNNWFNASHLDYETWAIQYPVEIPRKAKIAFAKQFRWSNNAGIVFTPTLLLDGYKVPAVYELEDLKYVIT